VLALVSGALIALIRPIQQAFVPEMVGDKQLPRAASMNSLMLNASQILGSSLAAVLLVAIGFEPLFLLNAASALVAVIGLWLINTAELVPVKRESPDQVKLRDGLRYVWKQPMLLTLLAMVTLVATFGQNAPVTMPLLAVDGLHAGPSAYGALSAATAVGAVIGSALGTLRHGKPRLRGVIGAALLYGLLTTASGLMPTVGLTAVVTGAAAISMLIYNTATGIYLQLSTPEEFRGRVIGLYWALLFVGKPLSSPLLGLVGEWFGGRAPTVISGAISVLAAVGTVLVLSRPADMGRMVGEYRISWRFHRSRVAALRVDDPRLAGINLDRVLTSTSRYQRIGEVVIDTLALAPHRTALTTGILDYLALDPAEQEPLRRHAFRIALLDELGPRQASRQGHISPAQRRAWQTAPASDRLADLTALIDNPRIGVLPRLAAVTKIRWGAADLAVAKAFARDLVQIQAELAALANEAQPAPEQLDQLTERVQTGITTIDQLIASNQPAKHSDTQGQPTRARSG
jgi:MFS family permease